MFGHHPSLRALIIAAAAIATSLVAMPAGAQNLVVNGGFDGTVGTAGSTWAGCLACWNGSAYGTTQQLDGSTNTANDTSVAGLLTGWTSANPAGNHNSNYNFILTAGQATGGFTGNQGALKLAGAITASPTGGNFFAMDGNYEQQAVYQLITGLSPGSSYTLAFSWAATQQLNFTGNVANAFVFGLLPTSANTNGVTNGVISSSTVVDNSTIKSTSYVTANQSWSGWAQYQTTFLASSASMVLSFLATSNTPNGQPPFALLDGVTLSQVTVPEPATAVLLIGGLLGLARMRRTSR